MNRKRVTKYLIIAAILAEAIGAVLNCIVILNNGGMPANGYQTAIDHWIPINEETKFAYLADIVQLGYVALSIGDLLIIAGTVAFLIVAWIALPEARKFFPLLAISTAGIFISATIPYNLVSTCLFDIAAVGTAVVMYWKHSSVLEVKSEIRASSSYRIEATHALYRRNKPVHLNTISKKIRIRHKRKQQYPESQLFDSSILP